MRYLKNLIISFIFLPVLSMIVKKGICQQKAITGQQISNPDDKASKPVLQFAFNGNTRSNGKNAVVQGDISYVKGFSKKALSIGKNGKQGSVEIPSNDLKLGDANDFSVQLMVKTSMASDQQAILLSTKDMTDNSLRSQKTAGWVLYHSHGTWAFNMGSGTRRITHEFENGTNMPLNDDEWHQLAVTYNRKLSEIRLYYDGKNKAVYHVNDLKGFDFSSDKPLRIGAQSGQISNRYIAHKEIEEGADNLQALVDAFNNLKIGNIEEAEFIDFVVDPGEVYDQKSRSVRERFIREDSLAVYEERKKVVLTDINSIRTKLMRSPFTTYQVKDFMDVAPLTKLYYLAFGKIYINQDAANKMANAEKFQQPEFEIDNLLLWDKVLDADQIAASFSLNKNIAVRNSEISPLSLITGVWNIHHGGKHNTIEKHGWDSRKRIIEIIKEKNVDILMMQESYSEGDYIAAELGYYYASSVDWDYLNQGSNISILSRFPIKEFYVPENAPFMNAGAKIAVSVSQDIYVMSNWYGMQQFPDVFDFHQQRFNQSDSIPILFGGDFNAVPHTDGGNSPASERLVKAGFTDAFRRLYPDAKKYPGHTHETGKRIDQLYFKGKGFKLLSTVQLSSWPTGFPSDHALIISKFEFPEE